MNLPTPTWFIALGRRLFAPDGRRAIRVLVLVAAVVTVASSILEFFNPWNGWVLFEDVATSVAPTLGAIAVGLAAWRADAEHKRFLKALTLALGLTAVGQLVTDLPDVFRVADFSAFEVVAEGCNVLGAIVAITAVRQVVYRRLAGATRLQSFLDGLIVMAAMMTGGLAIWLFAYSGADGQEPTLSPDSVASLLVLFVSAALLSTCAAAVLGAISLRVAPTWRGIWMVAAGLAMTDLAWNMWFALALSGAPAGMGPADVLFPLGTLLTVYGGATWSLRSGGGRRYERLGRATLDWVPIAAIVGCAILEVMPHPRPLEVDPIAVGTCAVVLLAVARQRMLQGKERVASRRLAAETSERAAATVALARLEAGATAEETADRICSEALRLAGIDAVAVFAFTAAGVVPIAHCGPACRPVGIGELMPEENGWNLTRRAESGLWIESWAGRVPGDDFDRATIESGLQAEALAPLVWNDERIGLLSMGAFSDSHALQLEDRLATVTEFSVMSAAILGPMLSERRNHDRLRSEVRGVIQDRAFAPVFQPIVRLATGEFIGYEALTRFSDGTRPDLRFLAADKVGMMVRLEMACLHLQIEQARQLPKGSFVSLNVSPKLATRVMPLLDVVAGADRPVVLEVTEHAEIEDYAVLMAALDQVRPHVLLAVDDAGAGYAGLHHILELGPQFVKLDISLVRNIDSDPARQAMVNGMTRFAESAGCALIAEGIETENELTALKLLNVEYGQGYFLARPAPITAWAEAPAVSEHLRTARPKRRRKAAQAA